MRKDEDVSRRQRRKSIGSRIILPPFVSTVNIKSPEKKPVYGQSREFACCKISSGGWTDCESVKQRSDELTLKGILYFLSPSMYQLSEH